MKNASAQVFLPPPNARAVNPRSQQQQQLSRLNVRRASSCFRFGQSVF
jgi:hypothetical protein